MDENTENHTIKLLQEMRAEINTRFDNVDEQFRDVNTRIDGVMHIMSFLAGRSHDHEERLENLEAKK